MRWRYGQHDSFAELVDTAANFDCTVNDQRVFRHLIDKHGTDDASAAHDSAAHDSAAHDRAAHDSTAPDYHDNHDAAPANHHIPANHHVTANHHIAADHDHNHRCARTSTTAPRRLG